MSNLVHIYKNENNFFVIDGENLTVYKLPYMENVEEEEIRAYLQSMDMKKYKTYDNNTCIAKKCKRLILVLSTNCNLACKYCYAHGGNYGKNCFDSMKLDTLKNSIKTVLKVYPEGINYIQFFGGEPLLNKEVLERGIEYINNYMAEKRLELPKYTIVTNGTLVDDKTIDLFEKYFTSVTISLDGEKEINDASRVFKSQQKSVYESVVNAIEKINSRKRSYLLALEVTVTPYHIKKYVKNKSIDSISELKKLGIDTFQISPVFHTDDEYCLERENIQDVKDFFERWVIETFNGKSDLKGKFYSVGSILKAISKKCYSGNNCGAALTDIAIDTDGSIYPCFMFIGYEDYKIGNVNCFEYGQIKEINKKVRHKLINANNNYKCNNCWSKKLCSHSYGHCIGARLLVNGKIDEPVHIFCELGKTAIEAAITQAVNTFGV